MLLTAVAVLGASACTLQRSGYQFVRSPSTGTYLKVPSSWELFDAEEVAEAYEQSEPDARVAFTTAFDASPDANAVFDPMAAEPNGLIRVRALSAAERDGASLASIRKTIVDLDQAQEAGVLRGVKGEEIQDAKGLRGQRVVFSLEIEGELTTMSKTALVDAKTSKLYTLLVGCRASCYEKHKGNIDKVVESLTIKET